MLTDIYPMTTRFTVHKYNLNDNLCPWFPGTGHTIHAVRIQDMKLRSYSPSFARTDPVSKRDSDKR